MSYSLSRTITAKEYQVTFAQVAAGYPVAFFQLAVRAARQAYAVGFLIELGYQAGAVRSMFAVAAGTVGSAYPLGGIDVQLVSPISIPRRTEACANAL